MDFKQFSASLGDFVLGTQILKDNLSAILKQKASGLDDFLTSESFLRAFGPSMVEELKGLVQEKDFFLEEVASTFMDLDDFEESEPFENACRRLLEAKKKLYSLNRTVVSKLRD